MQRLRIKSLQRLEGVRSSEEPALPTDDKGRLRSPPSRGPSREASPRETASEKSPRRSSRRDNDLTMKEKSRYVLDDLHGLTLARREQLKTPAVVVSVTELGEELVSLGKSPRCVLLLSIILIRNSSPRNERRMSRKDVLDKFQGRALLVAKTDLPEQLYTWGEGYVRNCIQLAALAHPCREPLLCPYSQRM